MNAIGGRRLLPQRENHNERRPMELIVCFYRRHTVAWELSGPFWEARPFFPFDIVPRISFSDPLPPFHWPGLLCPSDAHVHWQKQYHGTTPRCSRYYFDFNCHRHRWPLVSSLTTTIATSTVSIGGVAAAVAAAVASAFAGLDFPFGRLPIISLPVFLGVLHIFQHRRFHRIG